MKTEMHEIPVRKFKSIIIRLRNEIKEHTNSKVNSKIRKLAE